MSVFPNPTFDLTPSDGPWLTLRSDAGHVVHIFILEADLIRLLILPHGRLRGPRTWAICPGGEDVPHEGRDRFDVSGFTQPLYLISNNVDSLELNTGAIKLTLRKSGLLCRFDVLRNGSFHTVAADRRTQAYNFGFWDDRVYHYLQRHDDERYFGLGERSGDLDRAGQRFRLCNIDAMGYSARTSDPLYKHIPFYITHRARSGAACGLFYDTLSDCTFDFGKEIDNYHGPYRSFVADHGDLDLYFIAGGSIADIVKRYTWLTGRPALLPRLALGYSGSTMTYTDAPDAQRQMDVFLDRCREHDIPCDSFHLSSGYTTANGKRYVFTWDRDKFPDPQAFTARYLQHGVRLCANIKPCLLRDHPLFARAAAEGLFIRDGDGEDAAPLLVQFWDDVGAYLDFTNPRTCEFWQQQITQSLLQVGISATWNDNNEYEIWSPRARLHAHATPRAAWEQRPLQPLLMMRASRQAQQHFAPRLRPFVVSRSGAAGMQRYAQTWSGDNYTSWETLRYNLRMGLGLALSGVSNSGHDVGGIAGPAPSADLFLRWIQCGIFMPRFSIHSWNSDGSVNEPWMHPQIMSEVRELFRLRYRLIPYLYDLMYRAHVHYEPMLRPTFYDFPDDARCYEACDEAMLGSSLLIAPVVEPECTERRVYLPAGTDWHCFHSGERYTGGALTTLPARGWRPVLLARQGAIVPLDLATPHFAQPAHELGFAIFPPRDGDVASTEIFVDDGESEAYREGLFFTYRIEVQARSDVLRLKVTRSGQLPSPDDAIALLLPRLETRPVELHGAALEQETPPSYSRLAQRLIRVRL